ncbi:MAG TPA: hypothetical protein VFN78_03865 [Ktedonobacterales bacterium]|nr:hypothetical protein [Ktedonobacterales bacterium]
MSHDRRDDTAAVSVWLRALAKRAEGDSAFAAQLLATLRESGLASALTGEAPSASAPRARTARTRALTRPVEAASETTAPPDPFALFRSQGEDGLRAALDGMELATLRAIVRERRLDPARISARWTTRERVIALIVDQVKARANHGHAFGRV